MKKCWLAILAPFLLFSCGLSNPTTFTILSGSENQPLQPLVEEFALKEGVKVQFVYQGSVDIMLALQKKEKAFDAVWPASGLWISLGDRDHAVKHAQTVLTTPVVFGVRQSLARQFGWVGRDVKVAEILEKIEKGQLKFLMTSASQSNSGASAYLGFLYALSHNPDVLTQDQLHNPELKDRVRKLLGGINRSSGSSGWLKDLFLAGNYDAMVNYEALVIEANQALTASGREPLYAVYPQDGLVIADSQLGWVDSGSKEKEDFFLRLQTYLLSDEVQKKLLDLGRRTGVAGFGSAPPPAVFNSAWGIDPNRVLSPIRLPSADVIRESLRLYQTDFKKPSLTYFCLDYSGSMAGERIEQLQQAMGLLLEPETSAQYLLQPSGDDVTVVIPFSTAPIDLWKVVGNKSSDLEALFNKIKAQRVGGSTDIYSPLVQALGEMKDSALSRYVPAVILMTDGESNVGLKFADFQREKVRLGLDVPVFPILFGDASEEQMKALADFTLGQVFDGRGDLIAAFKKAKGYN